MKKIISLIACLALLLAFCVNATAAGTASISGASAVTVGNNIELTVSVSGCSDASSVAVAVSYGDAFELVSGNWLKSGMITNFDTSTKKGALGGLSSPDINGNLFKLVLKAKTASANAQNVSINVIAKSGSTEIMNVVPTKSVRINCATHSYGGWEKNNGTNHKHTCSACGEVAYENHKWNSGEETKKADCKEPGNKKYTCTVCGEIKNETIPKTNSHDYGSYTETKAATCTTDGSKKATCSVCGKEDVKPITKLGHKMGDWKTTKEATCEAKGTKVRECERNNCNHKETQDIAALGHKFSKATVTKEPTCTETGIETGTCTRCKKETTNTIKAKGHSFAKWEDVKAATCTEAGEQKRKCKNCDHTETKKVEALGHDFENPTIVTQPTIASTGIAEGKCKRCGEVTQRVLPCTATDTATGIVFEAEQGVFQSGTQMSVTELAKDAADYEAVKSSLAEIAGEFKAYGISAVLNGATVQPNGTYKATFAIPEDYSSEVALYGIAADGTATLIEAAVSEDGKTLTADITDYNYYVVCDLSTVESEKTDTPVKDGEDDKGGKDNSLIIYIVIGVLVLLIVAGVVIFFVMKKKKKTAPVEEADDTFTIE